MGYFRDTIRRSVSNPRIFLRAVNRFYFNRFSRWDYNENGTSIFDEDWDNLIILDACRYDIFADLHSLSGKLKRMESQASDTVKFLKSNFSDKTLHDTVYVTGNAQLAKFKQEINVSFHAEDHVWSDHWDNEEKTVLPEVMTDRAIEIASLFPNKRLIIHYMQPHYPFIGSEFNIDKMVSDFGGRFWQRRFNGKIDLPASAIWEAYIGNLEHTLPHIQRLISKLQGKSVVTADHGNMIGDRARPIPIQEWGHPTGIYTKELVEVPWFIVEGYQRKHIEEEPPIGELNEVDREIVGQRLRDLGYLEN